MPEGVPIPVPTCCHPTVSLLVCSTLPEGCLKHPCGHGSWLLI